MSRKRRLTVLGVVVTIFGVLTGGLTHLDNGRERLGWTMVGGAGIASIVLASRLRRLREAEPGPAADSIRE